MLMQTHEARLDALRTELANRDLQGFFVPISDEHMSEYVGDYAQRLQWLTGFAGSAGSAVVLKDNAAMFVDGRYTLQVTEQVDGKLYEYKGVPQDDPADWIGANAAEGSRIGYDAWLHTRGWVSSMTEKLAEHGITLVPVDGNPIDAVWQDRPEPSPAKAFVQANEHAGRSSSAKRSEIAEWLKAKKLDAAVISALDSVAWTLNIRGKDVPRTPVALSYLLVHADGTAEWFIKEDKVDDEVRQSLGNAVRITPRDAFEGSLSGLKGKRVAVDPNYGVAGIFQALEDGGASPVAVTDPAILPKAQKNPAEQQGHRDAQARDGAAVARFLRWLEVEGPKGGVDELSAAARLQEFRQAHGDLRDLSFDTISAAGPHGASPHYRVDEDSNIPLAPGSVYLVDSGGQYPDGTTDITRTVWIAGEGDAANPPAEVRDRFTRVLKGHIALDRQVFPAGTQGGQLDAIARMHLWQAGCDYAHGTGHGVGSFLMVHEGPQRIAKPGGAYAGTAQPLLEGMILSNEPGYYKAGEYGIRIENLVLTEKREIANADAGEWLGFETLTLVPIARNMLDVDLLDADERAWWNSYHAKVHGVLAPQLEGADREWLDDACKPI
ncbi:aminopeptidase P family protein [Paraurantiacibacter namhicola]|uniref:Aminopeptidase n=1 Tax=Paraurantiacibacter namhicola TaxID=645517 RepID=A0A1C7D676_9SPHN|nr:aminopeptidase P family protein [Paraurantiacibacter namhicola]ANU06958.1 Aminopeptidase [Paraurantiacibacter namhicola]